LLPHLTVSENLGFGLMLRHFSKEEIGRSVRQAAELLNLSPLLERKPPALSGGECQRVALGRALVRQPKVFLFDEPLSNLDTPMRLQLRGEIASVHRRVGAMMIYVTHDQSEAMALADRVAVMRNGVLQQIAAPLEIYRHPANQFVAGFIGSPPMNFFGGIITRNNRELVFRGAFEIALPDTRSKTMQPYIDRPAILGVRPEHISEAAAPGVSALVERVEPTGPENLSYCSSNGAVFIMRLPASRLAKAGEQLSLGFDMANAHFFNSQTGAAIL
jgi:multiple sugar transport system ATP-binding protein